ncbi:microcystin degradation protein MlrC [Arcanobacterium wilhelmae]|uniref:Microcystin degradation protein MlrC n=1 Tax=Arcanobacterium wilhelmae TaxID=1803177 RepID=A0ABT9N9S0_9ACTO|nr:M81 family metallopeptidase [Arcanobacterium wilhelmae]MDP9800449.1 microcystin degradation protein MlrC [Arcanobacterium wilhelmae]WFN89869.1 M81 family metallopeptidase [Arcanobacterium wilhelmae]
MRIAICGIHIESSTFTPYTSTAADFRVRRGEELLERYPFITYDPVPMAERVSDLLGGVDREAVGVREWEEGVEWVPILHAAALPGGVVQREAYEAWKLEICEGLARAAGDAGARVDADAPVETDAASTDDASGAPASDHTQVPGLDGIFFDIHGAMSVQGMDDVEGDLITAIREVVGPQPLVGACMDLHGNVSETLFHETDLLTCYRMAPHEDAWVTRERAARTLVERVRSGRGKPAKALVHVPILLPGEKTSTRMQPAARLYDEVAEAAALPGIIDAAFWIGFAWADQPRCSAAIGVYGDADGETDVSEVALAIAKDVWEAREEFEFVAPTDTIEEALEAACAPDAPRPFFISDSGDNPGAGGADDVTVALAAALARPEIASGEVGGIVASLVDPAAVDAARAAGVGARVHVEVGGKIDQLAPPVPLDAQVRALTEDPTGGLTAVLRVGRLDVIVSTNRNQYGEASQFARLGLDMRDANIVIVKMGYLEPDLHAAANGWLLALTPGGVDQDIVRLGHAQIRRPMFPFDRPETVDLRVIRG